MKIMQNSDRIIISIFDTSRFLLDLTTRFNRYNFLYILFQRNRYNFYIFFTIFGRSASFTYFFIKFLTKFVNIFDESIFLKGIHMSGKNSMFEIIFIMNFAHRAKGISLGWFWKKLNNIKYTIYYFSSDISLAFP